MHTHAHNIHACAHTGTHMEGRAVGSFKTLTCQQQMNCMITCYTDLQACEMTLRPRSSYKGSIKPRLGCVQETEPWRCERDSFLQEASLRRRRAVTEEPSELEQDDTEEVYPGDSCPSSHTSPSHCLPLKIQSIRTLVKQWSAEQSPEPGQPIWCPGREMTKIPPGRKAPTTVSVIDPCSSTSAWPLPLLPGGLTELHHHKSLA